MTREDRAAHWDAVSGRTSQRPNLMVTIIGIAVPLVFLALAIVAWALMP